MNTCYEVIDPEEQTVIGYETNVESEEDKEFLILLPHTVVDPGTVMIHLLDTPLANRTVMSSLRFDTAALRALEDDLSFFEPHPLYILLSSITPGYCSWICEHGSQVGADCEESQGLKYKPIYHAKNFVRMREQDHTENHKFGIEDQEPSEEYTKEATHVLYTPHIPTKAPVLIVYMQRHCPTASSYTEILTDIHLHRVVLASSSPHFVILNYASRPN